MKNVIIEYSLLAFVLSIVAMITGGALAEGLLSYWLKLNSDGSAWFTLVAFGASTLC